MDAEMSAASGGADRDRVTTECECLDEEETSPPDLDAVSPANIASAEASTSRSHSRKRKRSIDESSRKARIRSKRLRGYLSPAYRDSLNQEIRNAALSGTSEEESALPDSQIGASYWSSAEKLRFFKQLARSDQGDLATLAKAVATKSQPEIQQYLLLLREAAAEHEATAHSASLHNLADVPAALEIDTACETHLDLAAEALAAHIERHEAKTAKKQYGEYSLIDMNLATELEDEAAAIIDTPFDDSETTQAVAAALPIPAAYFLRPQAWLTLSSKLYMSRALGDEDADWNYNAVDTAPSPAITNTALEDFHNLTISITRRLIQTSLFQAQSRLRAKRDSHPQPLVRTSDVRTAVEVLGMRHDWKDYWASLPRRCGLDVYPSEKSRRKSGQSGGRTKLTYDELENELGLKCNASNHLEEVKVHSHDDRPEDGNIDDKTSSSVSDSNSPKSTLNGVEIEHIDEVVSEREILQNPECNQNPSTRPGNTSRQYSPDTHNRLENAYLEALDHQASKAEEARLWEVLGRRPTISKRKSSTEAWLERPPKRRREQGDMWHWSKRVEHVAEWEREEGVVPAVAFHRSQSKPQVRPPEGSDRQQGDMGDIEERWIDKRGMFSSLGGPTYGGAPVSAVSDESEETEDDLLNDPADSQMRTSDDSEGEELSSPSTESKP